MHSLEKRDQLALAPAAFEGADHEQDPWKMGVMDANRSNHVARSLLPGRIGLADDATVEQPSDRTIRAQRYRSAVTG